MAGSAQVTCKLLWSSLSRQTPHCKMWCMVACCRTFEYHRHHHCFSICSLLQAASHGKNGGLKLDHWSFLRHQSVLGLCALLASRQPPKQLSQIQHPDAGVYPSWAAHWTCEALAMACLTWLSAAQTGACLQVLAETAALKEELDQSSLP